MLKTFVGEAPGLIIDGRIVWFLDGKKDWQVLVGVIQAVSATEVA